MANNIFQSIGNLFSTAKNNVQSNVMSLRDRVNEFTRSIPLRIERETIRPKSNYLGQQVAKIAGINNPNPKRGLMNSLSDAKSKISFDYYNSPSQNQGFISPRSWTPPTGAVIMNTPKSTSVTSYQLPQTTVKITPRSVGSTTTSSTSTVKTIPNMIQGFTREGSGKDYYQQIIDAANVNNLNPAVLAGLLFQESGITPNAYNESYVRDKQGNLVKTMDRGMAQINSFYHPEITEQQAYDPNFAINWAAQQIAGNLGHFDNDINRALAAYNVGRGGANIRGPEVYGGGPRGQLYLNRLSRNLTPDLLQELGIKTGDIVSPPESYMTQKELADYYSRQS